MPRKLKLDEVINMEEGDVIPAVSGIVEQIEATYHGTSKKDGKPFHVQNLVIKDGTLRMKVKVWGREVEIPFAVRGKLLTFISSNTKRGLQGVKVSLSTNQSETVKVIHVTDKAEIIEGAGQWENQPAASAAPRRSPATQQELESQKAAASTGMKMANTGRQAANKPLSREFDSEGVDDGDTGPQDPPPQQQTPPPASPRRESVEPGPWFGSPEDWKKFDSAAFKQYRLMQRTLTMTHAIQAWAEQRGIVVTAEHFQAMQAQLFIEANRQHLGDLVPQCEPPEPKA